MSPTVHELIGRIIDPGTSAPRRAAAPRALPAHEPLPVLLARVVGPPPAAAARPLAAAA